MRILITGGGTAGHLNPGLALAQHLIKIEPSSDILFVGTRDKIESTAVPQAGFKIRFSSASGFQRKFNFGLVQTVLRNILGIFQASRIIAEHRPDVIFATGGYVCVPILTVARLKKIPYVLHEQNAVPGLTVKMFGKSAAAICVSLKGSEKNFPRGKAILTGNPLREQFSEISSKPVKGSMKSGYDSITNDSRSDTGGISILVFGGSLGARHLNETILSLLEDVQNGELKFRQKINIIHSSGTRDHSLVESYIENRVQLPKLKDLGLSYTLKPYINDMHAAMQEADIVISRAGATTIAEIIQLGIPSILVPYPFATADHQMKNAKLLEKDGAAIVIDDGDLNAHMLFTEISSLTDHRQHLINMRNDIKKLVTEQTVEKIFQIIADAKSARRN